MKNYKEICDNMRSISKHISNLTYYEHNMSFLLEYVNINDIEKYLRKKKLEKLKKLNL